MVKQPQAGSKLLAVQPCFPKLTGGNGMHVVAPIERRSGWDRARRFARAVAERLESRDSDRYTTDNDKEKRKGRVFLDYLRNARNATTIAEYSPRARDGAPVAVPIAWDEVNPRSTKPPRYGLGDVQDRWVDGDPWAGFSDIRQTITQAMERELGVG